MKTEPIVPAVWQRRDDGTPYAAMFDDVYHPASGAFAQAEQVFLRGNGLPERFSQCDRFVVLETGFGLGNNFLATWRAWRDAGRPCRELHFVSIEKHPLRQADLRDAHSASPCPDLARELVQAWPPLTPDLHRLAFDHDRVHLSLTLGDIATWLPELALRADAFFLDGFAPAKNPDMWQPRVFKALGRLAAPNATAATWSSARVVKDGLRTAGFVVKREPGANGKRDITIARYAPVWQRASYPSTRAARDEVSTPPKHVAIIGAGLAGCATAWALAQHGISSTVLDTHDEPASQASGNPAGIFHGVVHGDHGTHARLGRIASIHAARVIGQALNDGVPGRIDGLLRLQNKSTSEEPDLLASMQAVLVRLGLPADYASAMSAEQASQQAGVSIANAAWWFPQGGWVDPGALCRWWLQRAAAQARFVGNTPVARLERDGAGRWCVIDTCDRPATQADAVVLSNATQLDCLLPRPLHAIQAVRGQLSMLRAHCGPRVPVAGGTYAVTLNDGRLVFGATAQPGDTDPHVRDDDHQRNGEHLSQLFKLDSLLTAGWPLSGRVNWRAVTPDRLPLVGAAPASMDASLRLRHQAHIPGLFIFAGLGSRGITWAPLLAQSLAAGIAAAPSPLPASLRDAINPARFAWRRGALKAD